MEFRSIFSSNKAGSQLTVERRETSLFEAGFRRLLLPLCALGSLSGCGVNLHYLTQAAHGQFALLNRAKAISEVLEDEKTPPRIKKLLREIEPIKKFGEEHGLKPTGNYTEYVKLDREAAVWVVSACEALRFQGKEWSFPIVGKFPYLGWFDRKDAQEFADDLRQEGWDVDLRGARAYSTLGWFRDSILSSMIPDGKAVLGDLINVVLHESVHASLYLKDQAYFNESVASFMADQMTIEYLTQRLGQESEEKTAYLKSEEYSKKVEKKLHETYLLLNALYASQKSDDQKRQEKEALLGALQKDLSYRRPINNATLLQYKTYSSGQKDFEEVFEYSGRNWVKFLALLRRLKSESFARSQQEDLTAVLRSILF